MYYIFLATKNSKCFKHERMIWNFFENWFLEEHEITWSKGHCLRCRFAKQVRHIVWPHPSDIGPRMATSKSLQHTGQERNSVHCGACIGILKTKKIFHQTPTWHKFRWKYKIEKNNVLICRTIRYGIERYILQAALTPTIFRQFLLQFSGSKCI